MFTPIFALPLGWLSADPATVVLNTADSHLYSRAKFCKHSPINPPIPKHTHISSFTLRIADLDTNDSHLYSHAGSSKHSLINPLQNSSTVHDLKTQ